MDELSELGAALELYLTALTFDSFIHFEETREQAIEWMRKHNLPSPDEAVVEVFQNLPKYSDISTLNELDDFLMGLMSSELGVVPGSKESIDPRDFEKALLAELSNKTKHQFRVPIARAHPNIASHELGGRFKQRIETESIKNQSFLFLTGQVNCAHWGKALRTATTKREELLGALMAMDLLRVDFQSAPEWLIDPPLSLKCVQVECDEPHPWEDHYSLASSDFRELEWHLVALPFDVTDTEEAALKKHGPSAVLESRLSVALRAFSTSGPYGRRLRTASRFFRRASRTNVSGDCYLFLAICLESLLVEGKEDLATRVSDAVGFLLGNKHEERKELRDKTRRLYNVRSQYVHDGEYVGSELERDECIGIAKRVLQGEFRSLSA